VGVSGVLAKGLLRLVLAVVQWLVWPLAAVLTFGFGQALVQGGALQDVSGLGVLAVIFALIGWSCGKLAERVGEV
jgi:hypothetical protein